MRTGKWALWALAVLVAFQLAAGGASAEVASDRAAAILVFPKVVVEHISAESMTATDVTRDTLIQISNTTSDPVQLKCFYVDGSSRCTTSNLVCDPNEPQPCPEAKDLCLPGWIETDFRVTLTPHQPLAWSARTGLAKSDLPLDGTFRSGIGGSSNAGMSVPPVAAGESVIGDVMDGVTLLETTAYKGELKCIVVDSAGHAVPRNAVTGQATILTVVSAVSGPEHEQFPDAAQYSAIGIQAVGGDANGDGVLELGGASPEYDGCPNVLILDHFFDSAQAPVEPSNNGVRTDLTLVPCNEDLRNQIPGSTTAQFLVYNEFEQRFSTSTPVNCLFEKRLGQIDTRDPTRSIFSVYVAGTMAGQTRIRGVQGGLLGVAQQYTGFVNITIEKRQRFLPFNSAAANLHRQGERAAADRIVLP